MKRLLAASVGLTLVGGLSWWAAAERGTSPAPAVAPTGAVSGIPAGTSLGEALAGGTLEARSPEEVRAVVGFCRGAGEADVDELLVAAERSPDPLVAANALDALGRLGALDAESLRPFLADERARVRQSAIVALAHVERERAVEELVDYVRPDADPTERTLAIRSLGRVGGPDASRALAVLEEDEGLSDVDRVFLRSARREAAERGRTPVTPEGAR